jgi:hypothetical protein
MLMKDCGEGVGGVIVPLAARCEARRGCVAALVILPQVACGGDSSAGDMACDVIVAITPSNGARIDMVALRVIVLGPAPIRERGDGWLKCSRLGCDALHLTFARWRLAANVWRDDRVGLEWLASQFRLTDGRDSEAVNRRLNVHNGKQYCATNTAKADNAGRLPRRQGAPRNPDDTRGFVRAQIQTGE